MTEEVRSTTEDPTAHDRLVGLSARTGLSLRDVEAFVAAWERAGRPGTLEDFLGFVPEQRSASLNDQRRQA